MRIRLIVGISLLWTSTIMVSAQEKVTVEDQAAMVPIVIQDRDAAQNEKSLAQARLFIVREKYERAMKDLAAANAKIAELMKAQAEAPP